VLAVMADRLGRLYNLSAMCDENRRGRCMAEAAAEPAQQAQHHQQNVCTGHAVPDDSSGAVVASTGTGGRPQ